MITGHGDDGYLYDTAIVANFSSNVYGQGFNAGMKEQLISAIDKINTYPEANANSLQMALAGEYGLPADSVLVTNGATEAFYLIARYLQNKSVTIVIPSFAEYEDACKSNELTLQFFDWEKLSNHTIFATDAVFLGNPNNPTGAILKKEMLGCIIQNNPQTLFVIDEAYSDFTDEHTSLVNELTNLSNLIIVKSLTKTYAIPGLRLGYVLSNPSIIAGITCFKMPWSVNTMAIEAGNYIVKHLFKIPLPLNQLLLDTKTLIGQLNENQYIKAYPSHTNFFLCETRKESAADLKYFLLREHGILIRDAGNFRSLSKRHFRIATQTKDKNELLVKALQEWTTRF